MSITGLIKFTQGATTDIPGRSVIGVITTSVVLTNDPTNTGNSAIVFYEWNLLDVPLGSSLTPGVLSSSSSTSFIPDVPGCYRVQLTVRDGGGFEIVQIRNFGVRNSRSWLVPSFKSGQDELNFGGNAHGWAPYVDQIFADIVATVSGDASGNVAITATQSTWGDVVSKRWPEVTTTDATPTVIATFPLAAGTGYTLHYFVTGKGTANGDYFDQQFSETYSRDASASPVAGANPPSTPNPVAGGSAWSVVPVIVGNTVELHAVGAVATTVHWEVVSQIKATV